MEMQIPSPGMKRIFGAAGGNKLSVELLLPCLSGGSVSVFPVNVVWKTPWYSQCRGFGSWWFWRAALWWFCLPLQRRSSRFRPGSWGCAAHQGPLEGKRRGRNPEGAGWLHWAGAVLVEVTPCVVGLGLYPEGSWSLPVPLPGTCVCSIDGKRHEL